MALRGTATHRKIRRLANRLSIDPCFALGIMEAIWHTTAEQQPDGGIGRLTNEDIADEIFYTGPPDVLVEALIAEKLVDEIDGCRLYIHDWHEWADDSVRLRLVRTHQPFANGVEISWALARRPGSTQYTRRRIRDILAGGAISPEERWEIFFRDGHKCLSCGSTTDLTVDHTVPISFGGKKEKDNLKTLCRACNSRKGARL